ncbi:MAG: radical enzyme Cfr family [Phycisphaerales bacterium]|nr:radical enzyme Cfr family [Phycisphaerales bacterium]
MPALTDFDVSTLATELARAGCVPSHAGKLLRNFYDHHGHLDFTQIQVGKRVEALFTTELPQRQSTLVSRHVSADRTTKLLLGFTNGGAVEAVLMPGYRADRAAACVSSQIGCAMGCDFCASTRRGLERSLYAGEIVEQFLHLRAHAAAAGRRLTSLVFMGMGEPLLNLANVLDAIKRIAGSEMGALGWRQVTVSTVGIVPGIDALADADLNVHLALSLHAPDDATRATLVPMNRRYPVADIMAAARRFHERTGRIVTIEYCLLAGVNDSDEHAATLAALMNSFRAHVNVIPYNPIGAGLSGRVYGRPSRERVVAFLTTLRDAGVVAHARDTRGDDVNAACGQLREVSAECGVQNAK